jgi:hypothetical protein
LRRGEGLRSGAGHGCLPPDLTVPTCPANPMRPRRSQQPEAATGAAD